MTAKPTQPSVTEANPFGGASTSTPAGRKAETMLTASLKKKKLKERTGVDTTKQDGTAQGYFRSVSGEVDGDSPLREQITQAFFVAHPDVVMRINPDAEDKKLEGFAEWREGCWQWHSTTDLQRLIRLQAHTITKIDGLSKPVKEAYDDIVSYLWASNQRVDIGDWDKGLVGLLLSCGKRTLRLIPPYGIYQTVRNEFLYQTRVPVSEEELNTAAQEIKGGDDLMKDLMQTAHGNNEALKHWLQVILGQGLIGNPAKLALLFWGPQNTGKSTIQEAIGATLGKRLVYPTPNEVYFDVKGKAQSDLAGIKLGVARFSIVGEVPERSSAWKSGGLKGIVSNTPMPVKDHYKGYSEVTPRVLPVIAGNYKPRLNSALDGMQRRLRVVKFSIPYGQGMDAEEAARKQYVAERYTAFLHRVRPHCLLWLMQGLIAWDANYKNTKTKAPPCREIDQWSGQYFEGDDEFTQAFKVECIPAPEGAKGADAHVKLRHLKERFASFHEILFRYLRLNTQMKTVISERPALAKDLGVYEGVDVLKGWVLRGEADRLHYLRGGDDAVEGQRQT